MQPRLIIYACAAVTLLGCSERSSKQIGGAYYFETIKQPTILSEPSGGLTFRLLHKKDGKSTVISTNPLAPDIAFEWHTYGGNLVFVEGGSSSKPRLMLYSEKSGKTTIDEDIDNPPWRITADDGGVTCRCFENGQEKNDPAPKFYSADHLKNL